MRKLRTGTNLIRIFLVLGIILSLAGLIISVVSTSPNRMALVFLYVLNILSLVAVIRILVTRKLAERIKHIAKAMNMAADGELKERVTFDGETEMSLLAENFNSMME
ncbi:MAG: HAMP domain-containing protein, partial [Deltaproteobacteria bacterium]|nr:HAMP domain-containing protein [Deltaproteobacteria bacterium]